FASSKRPAEITHAQTSLNMRILRVIERIIITQKIALLGRPIDKEGNDRQQQSEDQRTRKQILDLILPADGIGPIRAVNLFANFHLPAGGFVISICRRSNDKLQFLPVRKQAALERLAEKTADGFPALLAIIQRPVIDIHADEFVREVAAHVAGVLQRVLHGLGAVIQAELDAGRERVGNLLADIRCKFFVNHIPAERQRQAVVLLAPPNAEVFAHDQSLVLISQLAFMNNEANFSHAIFYRRKNLVERHDDVIEFLRWFAEPELQRQKSAGH